MDYQRITVANEIARPPRACGSRPQSFRLRSILGRKLAGRRHLPLEQALRCRRSSSSICFTSALLKGAMSPKRKVGRSFGSATVLSPGEVESAPCCSRFLLSSVMPRGLPRRAAPLRGSDLCHTVKPRPLRFPTPGFQSFIRNARKLSSERRSSRVANGRTTSSVRPGAWLSSLHTRRRNHTGSATRAPR